FRLSRSGCDRLDRRSRSDDSTYEPRLAPRISWNTTYLQMSSSEITCKSRTGSINRVRVILLTGSELRHQFVRKALSLCDEIEILATYCEGAEQGLRARIDASPGSSEVMRRHVEGREGSEEDF